MRLEPGRLAAERVAVTGASGFVGRHLVARLQSAAGRVRTLQRQPAIQNDTGTDVRVGDVADAAFVDEALQGVDTVFHLAATTRGNPEECWRGTVIGTRNVVATCLRAGVRRLVYVSSLGILQHAGAEVRRPVTESAALEPWPLRRGVYTHTKLAAEQLVSDAIRTDALRAVIIRPGQIFGPGAERVTPNGVITMRGWNLVGDGKLCLPLVYVDDLVDALLAAAVAEGVDGRTIHVVDPTALTQNEYLERWRAKVRDVPLRRVAWFVAETGAAVASFGDFLLRREPRLSLYRVRSLRPLTPVDCTLARTELGWTPRVGAQEGLTRTFGERGARP